MKEGYIAMERLFQILLSILLIALLPGCASMSEGDPDRGATTVKQDVFGDRFDTIEYLPQNWAAADSLWFYTVTQGSNMMPYDFFMALERKGTSELIRSNENMNNRYRYLPQKATSSNPDGLPVGFVKDTYNGSDYIGLTCAACHTAQINHKGKGIRIDGGPAIADMETFMIDIVTSLWAIQKPGEDQKRFVQNVLARGNYKTEADVLADLEKHYRRLANYITINKTERHYGFARLDAFGRIYNRVLEHILDVRQLTELLRDPRIMKERVFTDAELKALTDNAGRVLSGAQRDQIFKNVVTRLNENGGWERLGDLRKKIFNSPNAPV
ncbi:MAG TPA: di-heme-cytochrome C peroxidase, partial [Nitrosospira sp.]